MATYSIGEMFGPVKVTSILEVRKSRLYLVSCSCGAEWVTSGPHLARIRRCPHSHLDRQPRHPLIRLWRGMLRRCLDPRDKSFPAYGGRGIDVCDRWINSFGSFVSDMGPRPEGTSLDRVDNDKGYSKGNCRWATPREQSNNRRNTIFIDFNGVRIPFSFICSGLGVQRDTAYSRFLRGYHIGVPAKEWRSIEQKFKDL